MENQSNQPWQPYEAANSTPATQRPFFPTGKKEVIFAGLILLASLGLCNFTIFGGFNLGFALAVIVCIACSFAYLLAAGCKPTAYSCSLLGLSIVIAAAFARTDDGFVKFVMLCFLTVSVNLGLCLMAGQNLRAPGSVRSLLDAPRTLFRLGMGRIPEAFQGLGQAFRRSGSIGQKGGAFLLGLCIAVPILAIMIPLLISADAAFDGLVALLPEFDFEEFLSTVILGSMLACVLYVRCVALRHSPNKTPKERTRKGLSPITVNTVLGSVCLVFLAYLLSQLAYFIGGFAGILPEEYTLAQYARRGFFEMAFLCAINLGIIVLSLGLIRKEKAVPMSTRLLCLFISIVTLFLVATASAKMFLYIGSYGLTRLRVLTQIIMLFLSLTTALVMVWLFVPKMPYMKAVVLAALIIGAATIWVDVDTQVAHYNVDAYLSGELKSIDLWYLNDLGNGAVPALAKLAKEAPDKDVAVTADTYLKSRGIHQYEDLRGWNFVNRIAEKYTN